MRATPPNAAARTALAGEPASPALVVRLRPTTPLTLLVLGVTGALLSTTAVFGVGLIDGGLFFTPFVLLFLALVPDAARAMGRNPRLVLSVQSISFHGWTEDAELAWEDVASVSADPAGSRRPRILVSGRPQALSWRTSSHRILLPLDPRPGRPGADSVMRSRSSRT